MPDGQYTQTIYSLLRDQKYTEVIAILTNELQFQPRNRAALSLLGYSYFQIQDYGNAADCYDQLTKFFPDCDSYNNYKLYHAQALFKAAMYQDALKVLQQIESPDYADRILQLQCSIQYELEEISQAKSFIGQMPPDSAESIVAQGCMLFKEEKFDDAKNKFQEALNLTGY